MARTFSNTPEPRYVEKAKFAENAEGGKALVLPAEAPANVTLVGVGTNNTQTMLNVGEGLTVDGSTLKASGGGNEVWVTTFYFQDTANFDEFFINIFSSIPLWQSTSTPPNDDATSEERVIEALSKVDLPTAVQTGYAYRHTSSSNAPTQLWGIPRLMSYTGSSFSISKVNIAYMSQNGIYTTSFDPKNVRIWSSRKVQ